MLWSGRRPAKHDTDTRLGAAVGSETCLNLWTHSHQWAPAVAVGSRGRAWVVWQSHGQDGFGGAIVARRFGAAGAGGSEVLINLERIGHQSDPVVAAARDGSALVAWTSWPPG